MRRITLPPCVTAALRDPEPPGNTVIVPVLVDWFPRLTKDQQMANSVARVYGKPIPYEDPNFVEIVLQREVAR